MSDPKNADINAVFFAGTKTPGLAVVEGSSGSPRKWQEQGGYGLTGATVRFTGLGLAKFDVLLKLYDAADWAAWQAFLPVLDPPKPGQLARALAVAHPYLKPLKINECVVLDISIPKTDEYGVTQIVVYCQAFRKPKITLAKPEGAKVTPTDPVDAQIDAKLQRVAQLEALAK